MGTNLLRAILVLAVAFFTGCGIDDLICNNATDCNDQNPCTDDDCDPAQGCTFLANEATCDDSNACTENDQCDQGVCNGSPLDCDDGDECTIDYCVPTMGCQTVAGMCADEDSGVSGDDLSHLFDLIAAALVDLMVNRQR